MHENGYSLHLSKISLYVMILKKLSVKYPSEQQETTNQCWQSVVQQTPKKSNYE